MDEWVMERYELAKERIAQIPDEKMAEEPYCDFFTKEAMLLQQVIHVMDHGIAMGLKSFSEENRTHRAGMVGSIANGIIMIGWLGIFLLGISG